MDLADLPGRPCPAAAALELVGDRWSLLVVREVSFGAHRFTRIQEGTGAPRDRLAARLKSLVEAGVLRRERYCDTPERYEYHLTDGRPGARPGDPGAARVGRAVGLRARPGHRPRALTGQRHTRTDLA